MSLDRENNLKVDSLRVEKFELGQRVEHYEYGFGRVIKDFEGTCSELEIMVEFDEGLPYLKKSAMAGYPGLHATEDSMYETTDIIDKKYLEKI